MKSPLRWPGGKRRLASAIIDRLPDHEAYVEACCGGAAVFWAKPREISRSEILNDRDGELINFYQILHKQGRKLAREVDAMPYSRLLFIRQRSASPRTAFARARRFWYLNRVSFGGGSKKKPSFGVKCSIRSMVLPISILSSLDATIERLRGVLFEAIDVSRLVELYDRETTAFYVDPPFYQTCQPYAHRFGVDDHARLAETLCAIRGAFLLSYDDCRPVRRLYRGMAIRSTVMRYTMGCISRTGGRSQAREVLISNRPIRPLVPA